MATPIPLREDVELPGENGGSPFQTGQATAVVSQRELSRFGFGRLLIVCDLALSAASFGLAAGLAELDGRGGPQLSWSVLLLLAVTLGVFYLLGLYEREVFVSRPLHLLILARSLFYAFLIGVSAAYLLRLPLVLSSRADVLAMFALFFVLAAVVRVGIVTAFYSRRVSRSEAVTLVVGDADRTERLRSRLRELRAFNRVKAFDTRCGGPDSGVWFKVLLSQTLRSTPVRVANVFIDAANLRPSTVFEFIGIAREEGAEVYVVSNLVRSLNCRRLLFDLFEAPIVRVKRTPVQRAGTTLERAFDIAVSATILVLVAPLMLVVAVAIKLTSPGPAILAQERIGRGGRPFKFYKFRSMTVSNDEQQHVEYMRRFIRSAGQIDTRQEAAEPQPIFKLVGDSRVTRVGRYLRKFSLDELPQFWNVLKGDMSVVGPRPPLAYEVDVYERWHGERLASKPGVSGLWQVQGRSRVTFDEMVFQDVMYALTRDLLVDTVVCLKTVPAAVVGHGAA